MALFAALLHATCNPLIKSTNDRLLAATVLSMAAVAKRATRVAVIRPARRADAV
jgi:hypothetical protein